MIANPTAGRGTTQKTLGQLRAAFAARGVDEFHETIAAGDEEILAARALEGGAETIVAIGGDGTCTRIAQAILTSKKPCRFAVIPTGTGNDVAKTLGVRNLSPSGIADLADRGDTTLMDVGRADGHYFLNSCGFGFDAAVLEATSRVRFLKGDAVYICSALRQLFTYRGIGVSRSGAGSSRQDTMLMVTVSNGRSLGGAFKIAPNASVLDGQLDVAFFRDSNVFDRIRVFAGAFRGTHLGMKSVTSERTESLSLEFAEPPAMEIDGELRRAASSTVNVECIPRALSVIAAPGALV